MLCLHHGRLGQQLSDDAAVTSPCHRKNNPSSFHHFPPFLSLPIPNSSPHPPSRGTQVEPDVPKLGIAGAALQRAAVCAWVCFEHSRVLRWAAHLAGLQEGQELAVIVRGEPEQDHNTEVSQEPRPHQDTWAMPPVLGSHSAVEARELSGERQGKLALNSVCHSWICSAQGEKHLMLTEKVRSHLRTLTLCSEQNNRLGSFITL